MPRSRGHFISSPAIDTPLFYIPTLYVLSIVPIFINTIRKMILGNMLSD
jgi:hypothetical protein